MNRTIDRDTAETDAHQKSSILVVSCHGTDEKLTSTVRKFGNSLLQTNSFKEATKPLFKFVKRTAANIGSRLAVHKSLALNNQVGCTEPCRNHSNCKCCKMIGANVTQTLGKPIQPAPGNCKTKNILYLVTCRQCSKPYIGRTVQHLANRMSGHRENFYKILRNSTDVDCQSDDYSLGLHLANEHACSNEADFDVNYNVQILKNCSPRTLEKDEHVYIHKYKTLSPLGLNKTSPFGLPILNPE